MTCEILMASYDRNDDQWNDINDNDKVILLL